MYSSGEFFFLATESVTILSVRYIGRVLIVPFVLSLNIAASRTHAADWPENYVVRENSESPDGQYGDPGTEKFEFHPNLHWEEGR